MVAWMPVRHPTSPAENANAANAFLNFNIFIILLFLSYIGTLRQSGDTYCKNGGKYIIKPAACIVGLR